VVDVGKYFVTKKPNLMRGERLYKELLLIPLSAEEQAQQAKARGRSDVLIRKRNRRLCARLYWLKKTQRWEYTAVLEELQKEFDLSIVTITEITQMDEWQVELRKLRNKDPDADYFRKKWPWMKW
jgi:hypothetical protein